MGPQLYRYGNEPAAGRIVYAAMLQWGRNFIVTENGKPDEERLNKAVLQWGCNFIVTERSRRRRPHLGNIASMGPQLYHYGKVVLECVQRVRCLASMGPQLYRYGKGTRTSGATTSLRCFNGAATLSLRKYGWCSRPAWGHCSFNGAATLSLRKYGWCSRPAWGHCSFNGAATLSLRKLSRRRTLVGR